MAYENEQEVRDIFGDSDEELDGNDSDIDFEGFPLVEREEGLQEKRLESEGESEENSGSEGEENEEELTFELSNFHISEFSGQPGLLVGFGDEPKADHFF